MEPIQQVKRVLQQLLAAHQELLALEKKKEQVLIEDRTQELVPILHDESKILKKINELENEREYWVEQYFLSKAFQQDSYTIRDLIQLVTHREEKENFIDLRQELQQIIEKLGQQNQLNQQLIRQSLDYVNLTLSIFTEEPDQGFTYKKDHASSNKASQPSRSFFDTKA